MKTFISLITVAVLALCLGAGCAKKQQVDTAKLEASFSASSEPSAKSEADKAVAAVKQQDWPAATASLQRLAANAKLTDSQKQAVKDTLEEIGKAIKDTANKAVDGANKALGDAQKSLPK
jgi:hypothetical protein